VKNIRGEFSEERFNSTKRVYEALYAEGKVRLANFQELFDSSSHPDVASGKKSPDQIMREFLGKWFKQDIDSIVTWEEFIDFYRDVSSSVD
jgi:sulfatase maturation enzyme AslB (radical SAM superfamily)